MIDQLLLPAVLLARSNPPAPHGFPWSFAVILVALAIFVALIFGGIATWRRR